MSKKKTVTWSSPKTLQSNTIPRKLKKRVRRPEWCTKYKGEHVYEVYEFDKSFRELKGRLAFWWPDWFPEEKKAIPHGKLYFTWKYRCTGCGRRETKHHSIIGEIL